MDQSQMTGEGTLRVRAGTARGALPVEGAIVRIRDYGIGEGGGRLLYTLRTDRDGVTAPAILPAPPAADSLSPSTGELPYAEYSMTVEKAGYYGSEFTRIPIFDGISSVQAVDLVPVSEFSDASDAGPRDRTGHEREW